jgi:TolB protein
MAITALAIACVAPRVHAQQPQQRPPRKVINGGLPAVSPDGKFVAFNAMRDTTQPPAVFVIGADGSGEKMIAQSSGPPAWFGNELLVQTPTAVQAVSLDGKTRMLTTPEGRGFAASPNGKWFVFSSGRMPMMQISIVPVDGSAPPKNLSGPGMAFNAVFSPDGRQIAYARLDSTRNMQMWLVNADGTNNHQITHFADADGHPQWPSWSPDGKWIAVQAGVYNQQSPTTNSAHIWLIDIASGAAKKIAVHDKPYLDETPSFFPDGRRIAFQSDRTGRMEVWVMNVDGSGARQLTK